MANRIPGNGASARNRLPLAIVVGSVIIAATLALTRKQDIPVTPVAAAPMPIATTSTDPNPAAFGPGTAPGGALPAGHPAVAGTNDQADLASMGVPAEEPSIRWTAPPRWERIPSMVSMRIATYRIPHAPGDAEDAELAITRAGGDVDANITRWLGQFDDKMTGPEKTVRAAASELATLIDSVTLVAK